MTKRVRNMVAIILLISFVTITALSFVFLTGQVEHECHHHECNICIIMQHVFHTLKGLATIGGMSIFLLWGHSNFKNHYGYIRKNELLRTLISQKVRMNN